MAVTAAVAMARLRGLAREVHDTGAIAVPMRRVRRAYGAQRLGSSILSEIQLTLLDLDVGYFPSPLPSDQDRMAILYDSKSPIADLVEAAPIPSSFRIDDYSDYTDYSTHRLIDHLLWDAVRSRAVIERLRGSLAEYDGEG